VVLQREIDALELERGDELNGLTGGIGALTGQQQAARGGRIFLEREEGTRIAASAITQR